MRSSFRNASVLADFFRASFANAVDVRESDDNSLVSWEIDSGNTCHDLTLPLLMLRVFANHANDPSALDHFALVANPLY